ncbi:hypothetical protein PRZ48_006503 [Zasmidium cellare]|uniref:RNase H type-1 domain-containing protein n=1 Tax=Zasmidium cellare TaxID=395010 RepID=A0ABR0EPL6_ZASCE|nr:hypothetical protein PRZ48_006503 [Zasmidium cellare]
MAEIVPLPLQATLQISIAVDFVHSQGVGIGITQKATTPTARVDTGCIQATTTEEINLGIPRERMATEGIKTALNARLLAILHALGLARRTIRKQGVRSKPQIRRVELVCDSEKVVEMVKHHVEHAPESYEGVKGRKLVKKVVAGVERLSRWGLRVSLVVAGRNGRDKIAARARTLARQKGSKACRDRRRHLQQARNIGEGAAQDEG